jgi:hypothetical protein
MIEHVRALQCPELTGTMICPLLKDTRFEPQSNVYAVVNAL